MLKYTLLLLSFFLFSFKESDETLKKGTLILNIEGIKLLEGNIGILIFNHEDGFPEVAEKAILSREIKVIDEKMQLSFEGLPYGDYAVALIHDVNGNKKFDKNALGIPKEPFGFSKNKNILLGLPNFQEASISLNQDESTMNIKLIKLL